MNKFKGKKKERNKLKEKSHWIILFVSLTIERNCNFSNLRWEMKNKLKYNFFLVIIPKENIILGYIKEHPQILGKKKMLSSDVKAK